MNEYRIKPIIRCHAENPSIILRYAACCNGIEIGAYTTRGKAAMAVSRAVATDSAAAFRMPSVRLSGRLGLSL